MLRSDFFLPWPAADVQGYVLNATPPRQPQAKENNNSRACAAETAGHAMRRIFALGPRPFFETQRAHKRKQKTLAIASGN